MVQIKHSVLVPAYNKVAYIQQALESIVTQSELPFEIVVQDDCSTDGTWDIILEYRSKYPDLITIVRNSANLGLLKSLHNIRSMPKGNVVSFCACDDMLHQDAVKHINDKIRADGLDPESESFLVITNSINLYPNGSMVKWDNFKERKISPIKTRLRYGLSYRDVGYSIQLLNRVKSDLEFDLLYPGLGVAIDLIRCFEEITQADKIIFINKYGGIYRKHVGIATQANEKLWQEHLLTYSVVEAKYGHLFDEKDRLYIEFVKKADSLQIDFSLLLYLNVLFCYLQNLGNFSSNNPAWKNIKFLFPSWVVKIIKKHISNFFLFVNLINDGLG